MSDPNAELSAQADLPSVPAVPAVPAAADVDASSPDPAVAAAPVKPPPIVPRLAERKIVNGRAHIAIGAGFSMSGKMIDLSENGTCVMLDDPIALKKVCNIQCDLFHNGAKYAFGLPVVVAYCVLVSGKGYKVGLQFGPRSAAATQTIAALLK